MCPHMSVMCFGSVSGSRRLSWAQSSRARTRAHKDGSLRLCVFRSVVASPAAKLITPPAAQRLPKEEASARGLVTVSVCLGTCPQHARVVAAPPQTAAGHIAVTLWLILLA